MGIEVDLINDPESSGQDLSVVYTNENGDLMDIEIIPIDLDE
jgi:hypothetical protein